jgi:hypothetical protein
MLDKGDSLRSRRGTDDSDTIANRKMTEESRNSAHLVDLTSSCGCKCWLKVHSFGQIFFGTTGRFFILDHSLRDRIT